MLVLFIPVSSFKFLNASRNELEVLPLLLFQIPSLETLDVSGNHLTSLPGPVTLSGAVSGQIASSDMTHHLWLCRQLKELDASDNCLSRLPETFGDVQQLRKLRLTRNKIALLPQSLCKAGCLELADLGDNCLGSSALSSLTYLPNSIQKLILSGNKLGCIPCPLLSFSRLRYLDCANNSILSLPDKGEWHLPHLDSLILHDNQLGDDVELPDSFGKSVTLLDLSHNQLKKFPQGVLGLKLAVSIKLKK